MNRGVLQLIVALLSALGVLSGHSLAQPNDAIGPQPPKFPTRQMTQEEADAEKLRLEKGITDAFARNEFGIAEVKLRELIPLDHENFVPWYNLACALSVQGKTDDAVQMLQQAIARGFADLQELQKDPHMAKVRGTPQYRAIVASWGEVVEKRSEKTIEAARKKFHVGEKGSPYSQEKDEGLRLIYISAFDPVLFAQAKKDAGKLAAWWHAMAGREERKTQGVESSSTQETPMTAPPWVLVILPTRTDYITWAQARYGDRYDRVGGEYNHDSKMLVSMDLGSSWRHEFWHVLHWRDMDRRGQRHPMWIMEGLCSLVEDCDTGPKGEMVPTTSWRTNMVRRLARNGNLIPFEMFFDANRKAFMGDRTLAFYGQARAMFLFLSAKGMLHEWYQMYVAGYKEDATGKSAFEQVLGKPIKEIEKEFRVWARQLPQVPEEVGRGPANLPVDVGIGTGDGPIVQIDALAEFTKPGNPAAEPSTLRNKDVITAIDGKPVADMNDLARVLGQYEAGATVSVAYIRGKTHGVVKVTLVGPR